MEQHLIKNTKWDSFVKLFTNYRLQASVAEQQRDEALNHVQILTDKLEQVSGQNGQPAVIPKDLRGLSIQTLKGLQVP